MDGEHLFDKLCTRYMRRGDSLTSMLLSFFIADETIHRIISCARSNSINDLGHQTQWLPIFVNEYAQQISDIICSATIHLTSEDFYEAVRYCFVELLRGQRQVGNMPPVAVAGHWNISVRGPSRCL